MALMQRAKTASAMQGAEGHAVGGDGGGAGVGAGRHGDAGREERTGGALPGGRRRGRVGGAGEARGEAEAVEVGDCARGGHGGHGAVFRGQACGQALIWGRLGSGQSRWKNVPRGWSVRS
jgi:hypothetical protein